MPDMEPRVYGMGGIQSPPDERDMQVSDLLAALSGKDEYKAGAVSLPSSYRAPGLPPVMDQGTTPMCVAYSSGSMKNWQDKRDLDKFFNFDESRFFYSIGGGPNGAVARYALDRMLNYGYPEHGGVYASRHKITAYYSVDKSMSIIKHAIMRLGPILMLGPWYNNWIYNIPGSAILPRPDWGGNGHQVLVVGWDDDKGLEFQNSWGTLWGNNGRAWMPYWYAVNTMWEFWKTVDQITDKPDWSGRVRLAGPGCQVRGYVRTNLFARSYRNGYTHKVAADGSRGRQLWPNSARYKWNGFKTKDGFLRVRKSVNGTMRTLHIHESVARIVVRP